MKTTIKNKKTTNKNMKAAIKKTCMKTIKLNSQYKKTTYEKQCIDKYLVISCSFSLLSVVTIVTIGISYYYPYDKINYRLLSVAT